MDGVWMIEELQRRGFPTKNITVAKDGDKRLSGIASGRAIIQVDEGTGENFVILHPGANHCFTEEHYRGILRAGQPGDVLLVQGETNLLPLAMNYARRERGMQIIFNASPEPPPLAADWPALYPCDWLIVNEGEARALLGGREEKGQQTLLMASNEEWSPSGPADHPRLLRELSHFTGANNVIVTLGTAGSVALVERSFVRVPALRTDKVVDTTGAGDVFLGYFVASRYGEGASVEVALRMATAASSLAVQVEGALDGVPPREAVIKLLGPPMHTNGPEGISSSLHSGHSSEEHG